LKTVLFLYKAETQNTLSRP